MLNRIKIIEGNELVNIGELRELHRDKAFGEIPKKNVKVSKASQSKASKFLSSINPMVTYYNQIVANSNSPIAPNIKIKKMHRELVDLALAKGYEVDDELDNAIYQRIEIAVRGFITQDNAIPHFLEIDDDIIVMKNESLDANGKVDFIVIKTSTQRAYFIDVTTFKQFEKKNNEKHCYLLYDTKNSCYASVLINGLAFFRREYINERMKCWSEDKGMRIDSINFKNEYLKHKDEWILIKSNSFNKEYEVEIEELLSFLGD